jgi:ribonuclease P protein component
MQTFPPSLRLRNRTEFKETLDNGIKVVCPEMVVVATLSKTNKASEKLTRIGLIASKKVGNSVVRNRVKRNLRESFRIMHEGLSEQSEFSGVDLVVIARAKAAKTKQPEMQLAMAQSLTRLAKKLS